MREGTDGRESPGASEENGSSLARFLKKPLTRRQTILSLGAVIGIPALGSAYGFGVGPYWAVRETLRLRLNGFPGTLRAVHVSDLHFKGPRRPLPP